MQQQQQQRIETETNAGPCNQKHLTESGSVNLTEI